MSQPDSLLLSGTYQALAVVTARRRKLVEAEAVYDDARGRAVERIRMGETSGDVIADALLVANHIGDAEIEPVLRSLHERLLASEGQLYAFGHHSWQEYSDSDRTLMEHPPASFTVGLVPKGGLVFDCRHRSDMLLIPSSEQISLTPHYFGGDGNYCTWPFQARVGQPDVAVGGWVRYPPVLRIGPTEFQAWYREDRRAAELVLALKAGKNGIKRRDGSFERLLDGEVGNALIAALPVPELTLA